MQLIDTAESSEPVEPLENIPDDVVPEKGIEFMVDSLPFTIQASPLSEFRSGVVNIKEQTISFDGRDTVPDYLRAKLYSYGSCMFIPGLLLTYYLIEQVSWIPATFKLTDTELLAYAAKDDYGVISLLYNRSLSDNSTARRTLTFQLPQPQYLRVKNALEEKFPNKLTRDELKPSTAAGSSSAAMGIIIWLLFIVGTAMWHPMFPHKN